jgi:hypothetical protein
MRNWEVRQQSIRSLEPGHTVTPPFDSCSIRYKGLWATCTSNGDISCGRVNGVPQHVAILLARESKGTRERINYLRSSSVRMTRCFGSRLPYLCCLHFRSSFSCRLPTVNATSWRNALLECSKTDLHRRVCVSKSHHSPHVTAVDQDGQGGRFRRDLRYRRASNHDAVIR